MAELFGGALGVAGGLVTAVFAFALVGYILHRLGGGPPAVEFFFLVIVWVTLGALPLSLGLLIGSGGQSPSRRFCKRFGIAAVVLFVMLGTDAALGPNNWHTAFRRQKLPATNAADLKATFVSAHLQAPISKGTNVLWCGTFQMAWDEVCRLYGGDLQFFPNHPWVAALNRHEFSTDCLDEASYVAMAGTTGSGIHEKLRQAIADKFHGTFKPRFLPDKSLSPRPQDIVAYACLLKQLNFPVPFERLNEGLKFNSTPLFAFGIGRTEASHAGMFEQVSILDFRSPEDFVVELKTKSPGDRLILARVQPAGTLGDTIKRVGERVATGNPEPTATNDVLIVPRMSFDLTRRYTELEHRHLVPRGTNVAPDLLLLSALQNTKFEMNEKGVELRSEAHMEMGCARQIPPPRQHVMVFDQPFLVLMERTGARTPYFALWVDNPEILVRQ